MLSQLLNHERNAHNSARSPPTANDTAAAATTTTTTTTTSPPQPLSSSTNATEGSSQQQQSTSASMAGSALTMTAVEATMQNSDEHRPDLPRPYKCPLCDKAFHRLEHQTRHIRTHTGEKPHACGYPGCTKRFSRSDELTRHSRIHNNPNSRRGNKSHAAVQAANAVLNGGMYDNPAMQQQINQVAPFSSQMTPAPQMNPLAQPNAVNQINQINRGNQMNGLGGMNHITSMPPPPTNGTHSAPSSGMNSPNVSPPHSYATYSSNPGSYVGRNISGDMSPAQGGYHRPMDINLLATAASQVERENNNASQIPNQHLSLPTRAPYTYHNHPYHTGRMPSLSSYHYSSNPTSQPMSRSHSHDEEEQYNQRTAKKSRPGSPQSTAPPSPEFPHESTSPTPDHTPLATPSHSPRLRPQFFHNGVQLPTLHHLSLQNQPPPALAPVEPSADGQQPYVPAHHSGLRISEIMEAGSGAQRKLPIPMVQAKDNNFTKISELVNHDMGSGQVSARGSEAGGDLAERT